MSFSAEWLDLREAADHRARNPVIAERLTAHLAGQSAVRIVDLGCGSGSNLRATAPLLGPVQAWRLVDYDAALLEAARERLKHWADTASTEGDALILGKGGKSIAVTFLQADLNRDLDRALDPAPHLVTASALFDLISESWIRAFAGKLARLGTAFYTVLTYDGRDGWNPPHPLDAAVQAAFAAHQAGDKGFGPAAGPDGADALARAFAAAGFTVAEGDSPWRLGPEDNALLAPLIDGIARAAAETARLTEAEVNAWRQFRHDHSSKPGAEALTGHRDTLALPR